MPSVSDVIAAHLREWDTPPYVELAIFGSADPRFIAGELTVFCQQYLRAGIAEGLFHQSSIGSVTGVVLDDGRKVVIKAHQPFRSVQELAEIVRVQRHLHEQHLYAPAPLLAPASLVHGHATVEPFIDEGALMDAHRPAIRTALAQSLFDIVSCCAPLVSSSSLQPQLLAMRGEQLWPTPHSRLFDFERTAQGAQWIDVIASRAREQMREVGDLVIGHGDWRAEHVRFAGVKPIVAFDWDSLCRQREPCLVGFTMHSFCANWTLEQRQAPTVEEARAFLHAYEAARGRAFGVEERRVCTASFTYACAYTSRCAHALGQDERSIPGTFQHLLSLENERMMRL